MNILFISWDGPQVFYLETLFMPIFGGLRGIGYNFHVLQFTWGDDRRLQLTRETAADFGVSYRPVRVLRKPMAFGALLTAFKGRRDIGVAVRDWNIDVLMPRSTLPVLSCLQINRRAKLPMVFDADGLPLDEKIEFDGLCASGPSYRFLRDVEAQGVRQADLVLTRSDKAVDILLARAGAGVTRERFYKVSNGRNAKQFMPIDQDRRADIRTRLAVGGSVPLVVYAGSLGDKYQLSKMLALFTAVLARRPGARLLILTGSPELVAEGLGEFLDISSSVITLTVDHAEVSEYLAAADVGLALIKPSFSMQAATAIKVGEYLLCGLPVIATDGVGDTSSITPEVGFLMQQSSEDSIEQAASWFTEEVLPKREQFRLRCREMGLERHSLEASVACYQTALGTIDF